MKFLAILISLLVVCLSANCQSSKQLKAFTSESKQGGKLIRKTIKSLTLVKSGDTAFYILKYEVSNKDYRQFTDFVRDSIIMILLGRVYSAIEKSLRTGCPTYLTRIHWKRSKELVELIKNNGNIREKIGAFLLPPMERKGGQITFDTRKIIYEFSSFDWQMRFDKMINSNWIWPKAQDAHWGQYKIYPDTLVGIEGGLLPLSSTSESYFQYKLYNDYPVVGITAIQAMAFCDWKAHILNNELAKNGVSNYQFVVSLPTTAQWQKAENYQSKKPKRESATKQDKIAPVDFDPSCKKGIRNLNSNVAEWLSDSMYMDTTYTLRQPYPIAAGENFLNKTVTGIRYQPNKGYEHVGFRFVLTIKEIHPTNNCDEAQNSTTKSSSFDSILQVLLKNNWYSPSINE